MEEASLDLNIDLHLDLDFGSQIFRLRKKHVSVVVSIS